MHHNNLFIQVKVCTSLTNLKTWLIRLNHTDTERQLDEQPIVRLLVMDESLASPQNANTAPNAPRLGPASLEDSMSDSGFALPELSQQADNIDNIQLQPSSNPYPILNSILFRMYQGGDELEQHLETQTTHTINYNPNANPISHAAILSPRNFDSHSGQSRS